MAWNPWNRKDHFYQNSIKVVSADDPSKGYDASEVIDTETDEGKNQIKRKVYDNGLYRLIYLIRNRLARLKDTNWSLIDLDDDGKTTSSKSSLAHDKDLNDLDGSTQYNGQTGATETIGNYYHKYSSSALSSQEEREAKHYPKYLDTDSYSTVLKVSAPGGRGGRSAFDEKQFYVRQDLLQNNNVNKYERLHNGRTNLWGDWYVFIPFKEDDAKELGLIDDQGYPTDGWKDVFLRKKNDKTTGPIGFGNGNNSKNTELNKNIKIVLSTALYGTQEPSTFFSSYSSSYTPDKGQIYFQLEPASSGNGSSSINSTSDTDEPSIITDPDTPDVIGEEEFTG